MTDHPFRDVAIAAVHNTRQAKRLHGHDSLSIALEAARGVLERAQIAVVEVEGVFGEFATELVYELGVAPAASPFSGGGGISAVVDAAHAVARGACRVALVVGGGAALHSDFATAPWTRPANEFVVPFGMYTAMEFALVARRHMEVFGSTPDQFAAVAASIRNNGHVNPDAVYSGRGPFTVADVLASRMVADPFRLLDCAMTAEGGSAILLTTPALASDGPDEPVFMLGAGLERFGPAYRHAPSWDLTSRDADSCLGTIGRNAARAAYEQAGLGPQDVDVCELYDPFSFEVVRQLEVFGFCAPGEGGSFVAEGGIDPGGPLPTTTDGGLLSFSHGGATVQLLQRVVRAVEQIQGRSATRQVEGANVALCSNGGSAACFTDVLILGSQRP